jgi:hypothetical protein
MKHDAVSVVAMLVLAAFALERVTTGVFFLLSFYGPWKERFPEPASVADAGARSDAERRSRLSYFGLAGSMALLMVLLSPEIRVLHAMDMTAPALLDIGLTWLVLVAGSDRIGDLVKDRGIGAAERPPRPIQIEGSVTLVDSPEAKPHRIAG